MTDAKEYRYRSARQGGDGHVLYGEIAIGVAKYYGLDVSCDIALHPKGDRSVSFYGTIHRPPDYDFVAAMHPVAGPVYLDVVGLIRLWCHCKDNGRYWLRVTIDELRSGIKERENDLQKLIPVVLGRVHGLRIGYVTAETGAFHADVSEHPWVGTRDELPYV